MSKILKYKPEIIRSIRKTTRLEVRDNRVIVRTGIGVSDDKIAEILDQHQKWIDTKLSLFDEDGFFLLGKKYRVEKVVGERFGYKFSGERLICYLNNENQTDDLFDRIYVDNQDVLLKIIDDCVKRFPEKPKGIQIKRLKRAYGNCHRNRKISISLKVLKYSREFIRMVVYHELCHLVRMDHSREFYQLLERFCPDHRRLRKEPRIYGL